MIIKVIAFDLFGTVFDASSADEHDRERYVQCIQRWRTRRVYTPAAGVESFRNLKMFDDSLAGLTALRNAGYKLVAASNIPFTIVLDMAFNAGFHFDDILDLGKYEIYKPDLAAYAAICDLMKCDPKEVLMVTGNHGKYGIGDDTEPLKIGMQTAKIRRDSPIQNIIDLAATLKPTGEPT